MPDLVAVEGPSYASQGSGTWDRAGLWWLVVSSLLAEDIPVAVIPPTTLKKYATGKGNATKPDMRMAAYKRLSVDLRDDNQVDALWLAVAALDHLGHAQAVLPKVQRDCLAKVAWPARVEELSA
jgi:Holliday junction resolvasome RuvABC endonuclease subunit